MLYEVRREGAEEEKQEYSQGESRCLLQALFVWDRGKDDSIPKFTWVLTCVYFSKRQVKLGGQPGAWQQLSQQRQHQRKPRQLPALERSCPKRVQQAVSREAGQV